MDLALHYWECNCHTLVDYQIYQRVHPSNHDVCLTCDLTADQGKLALAGYAQAFFANLYRIDLEFVLL